MRAVLSIVAIALLIAACAQQPVASVAADAPGFLHGVLHGFICPGSLISSLFTDVRIYAFPNNGAWYDLGFTIGGFFISFIVTLILTAIF